ncbi:Gfo/Idh/MocA family oxidoreductase [Glaciecola sp. MH2013]|uniref:Gfo/Idh/MocA family protein n=1 Tax=Glaciecola sp. MH2013 TaxID=2785524 RepID=UPI00189F426E|nr:Gfo/Idh/MocA family oxidoreductase [Glaciecola sp. MH2013]MBF7072227.1 Gfo/Idh/MocA family oxidoreductase [Glaciecola sp. MH2013]
MSKVINIGVIGCANIADKYVIPAIQSMPDEFNLFAVCSRSAEKSEVYAKKYETLGIVGYEQLLLIEDIDAVYIPLPNSMHHEWIKKSLLKGKHVLVEKSLACSLGQVESLTSLAKSKGLVLIENFQFRFHPQLKVIKELITSGEIGAIRNLRSSFGFPPFLDEDNIRYSKELGGGALLDAGAYPIKVSQELLGEDLFVDSATLSYCGEKQVDIWGNAQLKSETGDVVSQISFGFDNFYQCSLEIWGSKGVIRAGRIFTCPPSTNATIELCNENGKKVLTVNAENHFENMLQYFYKLINKVLPVEVEYTSSIHQSKLISGVYKKSYEK